MSTEIIDSEIIELAGDEYQIFLQKQKWDNKIRYVVHGHRITNKKSDEILSILERLEIIENKLLKVRI